MREIKFRGQTGSGEWVRGDLVTLYKPRKAVHIAYEGTNQNWCHTIFREVLPSTVGQYTGLKDKNGKEIYEGDILLHEDVIIDGEYTKAPVVWQDGHFISCGVLGCGDWYGQHAIVVGNINDNPELMDDKL